MTMTMKAQSTNKIDKSEDMFSNIALSKSIIYESNE